MAASHEKTEARPIFRVFAGMLAALGGATILIMVISGEWRSLPGLGLGLSGFYLFWRIARYGRQ